MKWQSETRCEVNASPMIIAFTESNYRDVCAEAESQGYALSATTLGTAMAEACRSLVVVRQHLADALVENRRLQALTETLAERVNGQAELLAKRAEGIDHCAQCGRTVTGRTICEACRQGVTP